MLYDHPASSNALKVRFLLAELGLQYERVEVPLARPRPDWYLERYPFGTVPFLEDDGFALGESNAILRYLANRERRVNLYPEAPAERARVDWALDAWSTQIRGALFPGERVGLLRGPGDWSGRPDEADQGELATAFEGARPALDAAERFVAGNGTVVGTFTIADCAFAPVLWRWYRLPFSFAPWPKLARLRDTVTARPAFAAAEPAA